MLTVPVIPEGTSVEDSVDILYSVGRYFLEKYKDNPIIENKYLLLHAKECFSRGYHLNLDPILRWEWAVVQFYLGESCEENFSKAYLEILESQRTSQSYQNPFDKNFNKALGGLRENDLNKALIFFLNTEQNASYTSDINALFWTYLNAGSLYLFNECKWDEALKFFKKGYELFCQNKDYFESNAQILNAIYNLVHHYVMALLLKDKVELAVNFLQTFNKLHPDFTNTLGIYYYKVEENFEKALTCFQQAGGYVPPYILNLNQFFTLLALKKLGEAEQYLDNLKNLTVSSEMLPMGIKGFELHYYFGRSKKIEHLGLIPLYLGALLALKNNEKYKAAEFAEKVLAVIPNCAVMQLVIVASYEEKDEFVAANEKLQNMLLEEPDQEKIFEGYEEYKVTEGSELSMGNK